MSLGRRIKTKKELKNETKMDENQNKKNEKKIKFGIKFFLAFEKIKKFCIQRMKVLTTTVAIVTLLFTAVQPLLLLLPVPVAIIIFIVGVILINEILLFTQKSEKMRVIVKDGLNFIGGIIGKGNIGDQYLPDPVSEKIDWFYYLLYGFAILVLLYLIICILLMVNK